MPGNASVLGLVGSPNREGRTFRMVSAALEGAGKHGPASFVMVNILANAIEQLFSEGLEALVQPGGLLVLSGILLAQTAAIRACLQINGFNLIAQEHEEEWVCMLAERLRSGEK